MTWPAAACECPLQGSQSDRVTDGCWPGVALLAIAPVHALIGNQLASSLSMSVTSRDAAAPDCASGEDV